MCEDDSDCRFYNAIADFLEASKDQKWPDTHFVPCGGKGAIPKLVNALFALGVPTKIVGDIDILSDQKNCQTMDESLGGEWRDYEPDFKIVDSAVRKGVKPLTVDQIKKRVIEIVTNADKDVLPKSDIESALKQGKPWSIVKNVGVNAIPKGDASAAYERLDIALRSLGMYLVPEGEIEGFCRKIGKHGPRYVSEVLRTVPLDSPELRDAREFVGSIFQTT